LFALIALTALTACGSSVTVHVLQEGSEGELQPVSGLELEFLPFDRDSLFEAMSAAASDAEPVASAELQAAIDSVAVLQDSWRTAENEWGEVRDSLRILSDRLEGMDQRSREYRELFDAFNALDRRVTGLDRSRKEAFDLFTEVQTATQTRIDSLNAVRTSWEDVAFADWSDVVATLEEASGADVAYDTTDADGLVTRGLSGGPWYVHTRVPIAGAELYWNVPVSAAGGDTLRLTPENAERRTSR